MPSPFRFLLIALACWFVPATLAEAQIVQRFTGGGVQINAPFVRVNVGPFAATPGRFLGRRRLLRNQPPPPASQRRVAPRNLNTSAQPDSQPELADVDALPYPTAADLTGMDDKDLVETLRQMMARLHYRLSLLKTGEGWQKYLVLSREILGSPGTGAEIPFAGEIAKVLPRYYGTQDNPEYAKIAALPSFVATLAALQEVNRRFPQAESPTTGPTITDPASDGTTPVELPIDKSLEILPTPTPAAELPNASRGERSILKRK